MRLAEALVPIILLILLLAGAVASFGDGATGGPAQIALIVSGMVAAAIGVRKGLTWDMLEKAVIQSVSRSAVAILILLSVGALIGVWMAAGVIPTIIYYGSQVLSPTIFYVAALLVCAIVSVVIGSSWTTAGTIGIALISIASAMGLSVEVTAGAIISGAYFGDKLSPMSDTTNLASGLSGTDLFKHITFLLWTTTPSFVVALIFFAGATMMMSDVMPESQIEALRQSISETFSLNPVLFLPLLAMFGMGISRVPAFVAIFVSTLIGGLLGSVFQHTATDAGGLAGALEHVKAYWLAAASGYEASSGEPILDELLSGGGMDSMLTTIWLIVSAMFFSGMMERTGMLQRILVSLLLLFKKDGSLVAGAGVTALATNAIASDQYLSIVLTSRMYADEFKKRGLDPVNLSRAVEDSGTVTSPLVPWNTCGAFMAGTLGVPTLAYLPYCIFNLVNPVIAMLYAAMGFKIMRLGEDDAAPEINPAK
ncbi:MAG: Na+/H+ antiporter NhaC [Rhodospirillaceae bacterium]|nr:Na+/H+ antiporter NhaC [Rhodospirillaceae bacterium]MBT5566172.1 Na+/H+ antiporter NhaC [Rhodospirillaceae bacterium]MBT6088890.1 Na+/H+ antiporter NhaC [Rhodospirillaceae bacterium]